MKIIRLLLIILCTLAFSCQRYDDSAVWDELRDHKERIARLEALCETMNSNISALESIVEALQANDYVTGVTPISEEGQKVGYTITFSKNGAIDIYHGKDGADGTPGQDGAPGQDGTDGKDGHTPTIGVRKDTDGIYYWTLDGEWLTDNEGNKIPTTGADGTPGQDGEEGKPGLDGENGQDGKPGADGKPGQNGNDGITPLLKIENEFWYISYDNGKTWQQLYKAVGEDGAAGANGTDGAPGKDGNSFFQSVDTTNPNYIILTLADSTQIKIPTWKAFEELQTKVNQMNTNLAALQTILEAILNSDYVTEITTAIENGKEVGYTIHFSKSQPVTIYHGKDGVDGAPGQDGTPGQDGEDGKDGYTPVVSVKQDTDGNYYWTVDGEWMSSSDGEDNWVIEGGWLTDGQGNKIPATGKNGVTPVLKILDGHWYISYDNGKTWSDEPLGPATLKADGDIFSNITYDDDYLYITLASGVTITLSRHKQSLIELCDITPIDISDKSATFVGNLNIPSKDLIYSQVTIYYSTEEVFNIYDAQSVTTSSFDYSQSFTLHLNDLQPNTKYYYCLYIRVKKEEVYGNLHSFQTHIYTNPECGEWLSVLYTGDSDAHNEFMNYTETIGMLSNVPCAYLDPAIQSLLTGKRITKFACYTLGSKSSISFYTNPYDGVSNTTSYDRVLVGKLTDASSTTAAGTKTKTEYAIDIYIEDGHTLAIGDMKEMYSPINNANINISYKLPIYYGAVGGGKYSSKLPYFIAFDFYIEETE